ncbi:MAG: fused MFS/spermidine synthase, partial [Egibacteraceae bacterium]
VVAVRSSRAATTPAAVPAAAAPAVPLSWAVRLRWIGLAFLPSSLMLGVTTYLSTDVAAVPLLWIVPLAVYLATFIVAFSRRWSPLTLLARRGLPVLVLPALIAMGLTYGIGQPVAVIIGLHLVALLGVGMAAHGRLADERPPVERLTEFFLLISVGGVLGGLFNALIAPVVFNSLIEYPIVLLAALLACTPRFHGLRRRVAGLSIGVLPAAVLFVAPLVVGYLLRGADVHPAGVTLVALAVTPLAVVGYRVAERPARVILAVSLVALAILPGAQPSLHTERTFFGVHRVNDADGFRQLAHGTTVHGAQSLDPDEAHRPTTYYSQDGPVGDVMASRDGAGRIGGVGLGTGAIAAYAAAGQPMTFFEIDPAVVRIAQDDRLFTFLSGSRGDIDIVVGDGRLSLTEEPDASFDVLVLDAFSSDAVPVHLLTREAVDLYRSKLAPGGVMAFNISNRHLDLGPVLGGIAGELGLSGLTALDGGDGTRAHNASEWVVLADDSAALQDLGGGDGWSPLDTRPGGRVWTDDFSNILRTVRWW